jgi:hypothetical protein
VLLDELFGERRRHRKVARELHRELGLALGRGAEHRRVAEHLGEGHLGLDAGEALVLGGADDDAAALHEHADDAALELRGTLDATFMIGSRICGLALG